jgi:hypothetical protein
VGASVASTCGDCGAGTYSGLTAQTSVDTCTNCGAGTYSAAGASVCSDCAAGYDSTGLPALNVSCLACAPGKFKPTNGSSTCIFCPAKSFQDKSASTVCSVCPSSPVVGILSSGVGSTSVANCTLDTTSIHSRATAACNTSVFEQNIHRYRTGIAEVSGADIADVEILSYTERNPSQISRRLLTGVVSVEFNFRITVARYFSTSAIANIQGLQAWVAAQGLPGVVVGETLSPTCGAGAEPDPILNVSCRACEYGKKFFCDVLQVGFCHRFSCYRTDACLTQSVFAGFYKNASDNSSCVPCHNHATTLSTGAFLLSQCMCVPGYYSTDLLAFNMSCSECGLGHWCEGNQHRAPCAKVRVVVFAREM